jgi:hypothetical protein
MERGYPVPNRCPNLDDYDGNGEDDGHLLRWNDYPTLWDESENYIRPVRHVSIEEYNRSKK